MTLPKWALEAKARRQAALPGPWRVETDDYIRDEELEVMGIYSGNKRIVETDCGVYPPKLNDAEFIASCPETQERFEKALEIALNALVELANDPESKRINRRAHHAIAQIEALGEEK